MDFKLILGCLLMISVAGRANAQGCDAILAKELLTNTVSRDVTLKREAQRADFCRREGKRNQSGTDVSAEGNYGPIGGSASYGQSQSEEFKKEDCGSADAQSQADAFRYYAQRALGEQVVAAWSECMRRQDNLVCFASPPVPGANPVVHVVWRPTSRRSAFVSASKISNGTNVDRPESPTLVFGRGSALRLNDELVEIKRSNAALPTQLRLNVDQDGTAYGCTVTIPRMLPARKVAPARDDLLGRLRLLRFADLPQCQERRKQMLQIIEFAGGSSHSSAPFGSPPFGGLPTQSAQITPAMRAQMDRERNVRGAANREASLIQFDQVERMSKEDGCIR